MIKKGINIILMAVLLLAMVSSGAMRPARAADQSTSLTVHYLRFNKDFDSWNLWMWPYKPDNGDGQAYSFDGQDAYGAVSHVKVPGDNSEVGIIVRKGNWEARDGRPTVTLMLAKEMKFGLCRGCSKFFIIRLMLKKQPRLLSVMRI